MGGAVTKLELQANTAHIFGQPDPGKEDAKQKKRREEEELTEVRTLRISPGAILGATFAAMGGREGIRVEGLTPGGAWANSGDARIDDVVLKVNGKSALKLSRSELLGQLYKQTSPYNVSVISARGLGWDGDDDGAMAGQAFAASMGIAPISSPGAAATARTPNTSMAEAAAARELEEDEFEALVAQQGLSGALGFPDTEPSQWPTSDPLDPVEVELVAEPSLPTQWPTSDPPDYVDVELLGETFTPQTFTPLRNVQSDGTLVPPPEPPRDYEPRAETGATAASSGVVDADMADPDHLGDQLEGKLSHVELSRGPGQKLGLHITSATVGLGGRIAHVDEGSVCHAAGVQQGVVIAKVNDENMLDKDHDYIMQSLASAMSAGKVRLATVDVDHLDEVPVSDEALITAAARVPELKGEASNATFHSDGTVADAIIDDEPAWDPLGDGNATPTSEADDHLGELEDKLSHASLNAPIGEKLGLRLSSRVDGNGARVSHVGAGSVAHASGSIKVGSVIAKVNGENMLDKDHDYILAAIASTPGKVKLSTVDADHLDEVPVEDHHLQVDEGVAIASPFSKRAQSRADRADRADAGAVSKLQFEGATPRKQSIRRKADDTFGLTLFSSNELTGVRITHSAPEGEAQIADGEVVIEINGMEVVNTPHAEIIRHISETTAEHLEIVTVPAHEIEKVDAFKTPDSAAGDDEYLDLDKAVASSEPGRRGTFDTVSDGARTTLPQVTAGRAAIPVGTRRPPSTVRSPVAERIDGTDTGTIGGFPLLYRNELDNIMGLIIAKVRALAPTEWAEMTYSERIEVLHTVCVEHFRPAAGDVHHETKIIAAGSSPDVKLGLPDDLSAAQLKEINDALLTLPDDLSAAQIREIRNAQASGMAPDDIAMLVMEKKEEAFLSRRKLRKKSSAKPPVSETQGRPLSNASAASSEDHFGSDDGTDLLDGSSAPTVTYIPPDAAMVLAESLMAADAFVEETQFSGVHDSQDPDNFLDDEADMEHTVAPWRKAVLDKKDENEEADLAILIENSKGTLQRKYKRQLKHHMDKQADKSILDHLDERFANMQADLDAVHDGHRNVVLQKTPGAKYGLRLVGDANHRGARVQSIDSNGLASASGQVAVGDRVLAINNEPASQMTLGAIVEQLAANAVTLELKADDSPMPVVLSAEEIAEAADRSGKIITVSISKSTDPSTPGEPLGIRLYHSPTDLGARIQYVNPESEVGQSRILREHDCIVGINGQAVSQLGYDEVTDMLEHPQAHLELKVLRHAFEHPSVMTVNIDTAGSFGISTEGRPGLFLDGVGTTGVQGCEDGDRILSINGTCVLGMSHDAAGVILKLAEGTVELETVSVAVEGSSDFWDVLTKNAMSTTVHPGASLGMRLYNDHLDVVQARVLEVSPRGAAMAAGIPAGAVILAVNGKSVIQRPFHDISSMLASHARDGFDLTFGVPSNASHERVPLQRHVKVENHGNAGLGFDLSAPDTNGTVRVENLSADLRTQGLLQEGDAVLSINGVHVEGDTVVDELIKGERTVDVAVLSAGVDVWSNVNDLDAPAPAPASASLPITPTQLLRPPGPASSGNIASPANSRPTSSYYQDETAAMAAAPQKKAPPKKTGLPRAASTGAGGSRRSSTPKARNGSSNIARPTSSPHPPSSSKAQSSPASLGNGRGSSLSRDGALAVPEVLKRLGFEHEEVPVAIRRNVDGSIGIQIYSDDGVDGCLVGSLTDRLVEMGLRVRDHIVSIDGINVSLADVPEVLGVFGNTGTDIALVVNRVKGKDLSTPSTIRRAIAAAKAKSRTPSSLRTAGPGSPARPVPSVTSATSSPRRASNRGSAKDRLAAAAAKRNALKQSVRTPDGTPNGSQQQPQR